MYHILVGRDRHSAPRSFQLFFIIVAIAICLIVMANGATAMGKYLSKPPSNPFALFADIFPGQPQIAVETRRFQCTNGLYSYLTNTYCNLALPTGFFSQVSVVIGDGLINEISFRLREETLRVGDLMVLWGIPTVREYPHSVYFYWTDLNIFALVVDYTGQFSLYLPVQQVSIGSILALYTPIESPI